MQRLALQIPDVCKYCGAVGLVLPDYTVRGGVALMEWSCVACDREWPITAEDQQEERRRQPERRRRSRSDRRKS